MTSQDSISTTQPKQSIWRRSFGLRTLLVLVALISVGLAIREYQKKQARPNLNLTVEDVAWLTGYRVWKIDLTQLGPIYGIQVVLTEENAEGEATVKRLVRLMNNTVQSPLDTRLNQVLTIALRHEDGVMYGKWYSGGVSSDFKFPFDGSEATYFHNSPIRLDDENRFQMVNNRMGAINAAGNTEVKFDGISVQIQTEPIE